MMLQLNSGLLGTVTRDTHPWKFFRAGGFDQVRLDSGADIANLDQLDQKLWVALACPVQGLEFDVKTLQLIDTDMDGRIRAPEIIAAAKWAVSMLKNPDDLTKSSPSLALDQINDATPEGRTILASANGILQNLGKGDATAVTAEDTADTAKIFAQTRFNGDGVIPVSAADDPAIRAVLEEIIILVGSKDDRSGTPGVDVKLVEAFFTDLQAFSDWHAKAEADAATVMPLGAGTAAAFDAVEAVRAKVDDYFARCRLAAYDARSLGALNRQESEYLTIAAKDLTITSAEIAVLPLARIAAGKPLSLDQDVNPAWAARIASLQKLVVAPIVGNSKTTLSEADWAAVQQKLAGHAEWYAARPKTVVEPLGVARVREILNGRAADGIAALLAKDLELEPQATAIAAVDRLVRYHRDLYKLLNNFVSFRDFYRRTDKAVFQAGTLYLDTRSCDLCVRVEDAGRHGAMAHLSQAYLAYCEVTRKVTGQKMTVACAFTAGDSDNLMVGRNGIFYDRQGNDWDATITKIVDNPISIRQAFWAPYKRAIRWIEDQVAKRAAAADAARLATCLL
jgi:hypothetical protein